jgi:hypothetical protein
MTTFDEPIGPDNPRAWNPDDPALKRRGPYEPPAVIRMHHAGWPGKAMMDFLKLRGTKLMRALEMGLAEENGAYAQGRKIHSPVIGVEH